MFKYVTSSIKAYFFNDDALDYIDENVSAISALLLTWFLYLLFFVLGTLSQIYVFNQELIFDSYLKAGGMLSLILIFFAYPVFMLFNTGLFYFLLNLLGGNNTFKITFKYVASLEIFYGIFIFIFGFLIYLLLGESLVSGILLLTVMGLLLVWMFLVSLKVFSVLHGISKLKVFFALFILPFLILFCLIFLGFIVSIIINN